jgi:hypothetical protein
MDVVAVISGCFRRGKKVGVEGSSGPDVDVLWLL